MKGAFLPFYKTIVKDFLVSFSTHKFLQLSVAGK
jgi:hypothetical protein